jgi:hypothetical protein
MTNKETTALASKALLANVKIRRWTGRRLDRAVTDRVNQAEGADADAGRYNKLLLPKVAFEGINVAVRSARVAHYTMTLPWHDEGQRILPAELYSDFAKRFAEYKTNFNKAADEFAAKYPSYLTTAKKRLGKMWKDEDYPAPSEVRRMFNFHHWVQPCPTSDDFRVKLAKEHEQDIKAELEAMMKEALHNAMKDPIERITETVGKLSTRLKGYKPGDKAKGKKAEGTFRDSLIENIKELLVILPAFNLTGDPKMTALTDRIAKELCTKDAEILRNDETARKSVVKSADAILKAAEALLA